MNVSELGLNIKKFREQKGWTLNKLKQESGVGYATLHDIENGKSQNITTNNLEKIANALNTTTNDLLGFDVIELTVTDLETTQDAILESDELQVDKKAVTEKEKEILRAVYDLGLRLIRIGRESNENNSNL